MSKSDLYNDSAWEFYMKIVMKLIFLLFVVIKLHAAGRQLAIEQKETRTPIVKQEGLEEAKQQFVEKNLRVLEDLEQRKTLKLLRDQVEKGNIEFSENIEVVSEKLFQEEQGSQKVCLSSKGERYEVRRRKQEDEEQRRVLKKLRDHVERENIVFLEGLEDNLDTTVQIPAQSTQNAKISENSLESKELKAPNYQKRAARVERRQAMSALKVLEVEEKKKRMEQLDYACKSGRYAFLYKVPTWPVPALVHNKFDLVDVRVLY